MTDRRSAGRDEELEMWKLAKKVTGFHLTGWKATYVDEATNTALEQYMKYNEKSKKEDDPEKEEKRKKSLMKTIARRKAITLAERLNAIAMLNPEDLTYDGPFGGHIRRRIPEGGDIIVDPRDSGDPERDPERALLRKERREERKLMIRGAYAALDDPKHRTIISIRFGEGKGTNSEIAEECRYSQHNVPAHVGRAKDGMAIGLKILKHPRLRPELEIFVGILESRINANRESFPEEVEAAVSWAEKHADGSDVMPRQVATSLGQLWEEVDERGHRVRNEIRVKQRIVAACAAYVLLEEDKRPDRSAGGFHDDFEVIFAVRDTLGMGVMRRRSAIEVLSSWFSNSSDLS